MNKNQESRNALKSTGTVGGGQVINILISIVKTKIIAVILGTSGVGIVGILTTATDMIKSLSSFGLPFSGVRDISISDAKNDELEVSRVVKVFNKWVFISALLGALIALLFCLPLSKFLFNNDSYTFGIAFLSISIFFSVISSGFQAVMQGKRAILMMAKATVVSNLFGSLFSVLLYILFKENGIIPSLLIIGFVNFVVTYYFYKKLAIPDFGNIPLSESWMSAKGMIQIGLFTIVVSVFDQVAGLGLRAFISGKAGVDGVGLFTAANTVATMYLSVVLGAMASDYYPKLSSINEDNVKLQDSVNSQLYIVLLLASPIIIGMVGFADFAIRLLYSDKFIGAVAILKWQIAGDFFKIISWPCGFVFLAKGLGKLYIFFSISYTIVYMAIVYLGWDYFGFLGIGLSFFIAQFVAMFFSYFYSKVKFGIFISSSNFKVIAIFFILLVLAFYSQEFLIGFFRISVSLFAILVASLYSVHHLDAIMDIKGIVNKFFKKVK